MQYLWFDPFRSFASVGRWLHGNFPHWHWSSAGQEMLASWHDFMSYTPDRDDRFEEGERKSRGNGEISWKQRLKQLASVVHLGLRKHEIMDMYGGHDLYPAVAGTYWLHKTDFERLSLSKEVHLFQEIWKIVGRSLLPSIKKCQVKRPCACHFVACNLAAGEGELSALELRSTSFEWPKLNTILPTTAAPGVKYLALEGKDAFKHPEFWLQAFPAIKVLQLFVPSYHIENVAILLQGWRENLLGFSLHWNPELEILHQDPLEVPNVLWESICSLKKLRRLELDGCIDAFNHVFFSMFSPLLGKTRNIEETHNFAAFVPLLYPVSFAVINYTAILIIWTYMPTAHIISKWIENNNQVTSRGCLTAWVNYLFWSWMSEVVSSEMIWQCLKASSGWGRP